MCGSSFGRIYLKELGGCSSYQMVSRYARGNAGERVVMAHKASVLGTVNYSATPGLKDVGASCCSILSDTFVERRIRILLDIYS